MPFAAISQRQQFKDIWKKKTIFCPEKYSVHVVSSSSSLVHIWPHAGILIDSLLDISLFTIGSNNFKRRPNDSGHNAGNLGSIACW